MPIGQYTTHVELQRDEGGEVDAEGHSSENWQAKGRAWGRLTQIASSEQNTNDHKRSFATYSFETHYRRDLQVDANWRLKLGNRLLYLAGQPNNVDQRNRTWIFIVQERT